VSHLVTSDEGTLQTGNPNDPFQQDKRSINMIVGALKSSSSRRRCCKDNCEVKLIHTKSSQPLRWSEQPITFSRADHWVHIPDPGSYPLVVEPIIEGASNPSCRFFDVAIVVYWCCNNVLVCCNWSCS
jgi:hypothetical protein